MKAIWQGKVIAESNETIVIEGNHYFPPQSIAPQFFSASASRTFCYWKGEASYYNLNVAGNVNTDAAWFYPQPKEAAAEIKDYVAFWKGVTVIE